MKTNGLVFGRAAVGLFFVLCLALLPAAHSQTTVCGSTETAQLVAGGTSNSGFVTVSNDTANLYVQYSAIGIWTFTKTQLFVGTSLADVPLTTSGAPDPMKFPYMTTFSSPATSSIYTISLDSNGYTVGTTLYIAASAMIQQPANPPHGRGRGHGRRAKSETAWGEGTPFVSGNGAMYFTYVVQACDPTLPPCGQTINPGDFRTQSQGGWGTVANGGNPGTYRDAHFTTCFPSGVVVGDPAGFTLTLTTSQAVANFLPAGKTPSVFTRNHVDETSTEAGVLAGQVVALTLSVGFDLCDPAFGLSPTYLMDLVVNDPTSPFNGMTVQDVLNAANQVLGGTSTLYTPSQMSDVVSSINENFVDGTMVGGYLCLPTA